MLLLSFERSKFLFTHNYYPSVILFVGLSQGLERIPTCALGTTCERWERRNIQRFLQRPIWARFNHSFEATKSNLFLTWRWRNNDLAKTSHCVFASSYTINKTTFSWNMRTIIISVKGLRHVTGEKIEFMSINEKSISMRKTVHYSRLFFLPLNYVQILF